MKKTGKVLTTVVALAAVGTGAYFLIGPKGVIGPGGDTQELVVKQVDSVNKALTMRMDELAVEVKTAENQTTPKLDSLTKILEDTKWAPVENGGDYEAEAKGKFLIKKKETAKVFKEAYDANRITPESEILLDETKITE